MSQKNLYEITTHNRITYVPNWAAGLSYKDDFIEVAWCSITVNEGKFKGPAGYNTRMLINGEYVNSRDHSNLFNIVKKLRMNEVREELMGDKDTPERWGKPYSLGELANFVENIYNRAESGEFVGQSQDFLYVYEIAEILDYSHAEILKVIDEVLVPQERLALNGFILVSWDSFEKSRKDLMKRTGHKNINVSDFGLWLCSSCGKSGDEYTKPKDYACE